MRDQSSEECDDNNNSNGDGCSSNCLIESGFYWSGGSANSFDTWIVLVNIYFDSIDLDNTVSISFSQSINNSSITKSDISIEITGPADSYSFSYSISFISNKMLKIKLDENDILFGNNKEVMKITLNKSSFYSINGSPLYNNTVSWNPYQIVDNRAAIESAGTSVFNSLTVTIGVMMTSNIVL